MAPAPLGLAPCQAAGPHPAAPINQRRAPPPPPPLPPKKVKSADGKTGEIFVTADNPGAKPAKVVKMNIIAGGSLVNLVDGALVPGKI
jgi:hypothetical protein